MTGISTVFGWNFNDIALCLPDGYVSRVLRESLLWK